MGVHISMPLARGLPRPLSERLGRIVVRCTHVEYYLLLVTKRLLGINIAHARDLFSDGSWEVRFARLQRLAESKGFPLAPPRRFDRMLNSAETKRNLLLHAAWRQDQRRYFVHRARGAFARQPVEVEVDAAYLDAFAGELDACLSALRDLETATDVLIQRRP